MKSTRTLEKRLVELQRRLSYMKPEEPLTEPIGIVLGCDPQLFVSWFDKLLPSDSAWHELHFYDKYEITVDLCFRGQEENPEHLKQARVEVMDCIIETLRAMKQIKKTVGENSNPRFNSKIYDELWEKEGIGIKERLITLARYRGDVD